MLSISTVTIFLDLEALETSFFKSLTALISGNCSISVFSIPSFNVTSTMPHPWHPPPKRPELLVDVRGAGVDAVIEEIDIAAKSYPYKNTYSVWPGPNSNTFIAWIGRLVPELRLDLPATAIGKDWLGGGKIFARAPSGTGYQLSLFGLFGILLGLEEGLEINVFGLNFGIDALDTNLRLPGIGRIGPSNKVKPRTL